MRATRIENHEIEQFVTHCTTDATRWIIDGIDFGRWCIINKNGRNAETKWLTDVVTPYLKNRFDYLEVRNDGSLCGFRNGMSEVLHLDSYDADSLSQCMVAECPGQGWRFAFGCCRKRMMI